MASLTTCCLFLSLRTGSLVAAVISGLYSFFGLVIIILTWAHVTSGEALHHLEENIVDHNNAIAEHAATIFTFLLLLAWFIVSNLLLYGIARSKPQLLKSWIICSAVILCFFVLGLVSGICRVANGESDMIEDVFLAMVQTGFFMYLLLVVESYRREIASLTSYSAVAYVIPGNPYHPCEIPPKYEA